MIKIGCVLKSGGDFGPADVYRLAGEIQKYLDLPYTLTCLTDISDKMDLHPRIATSLSLEVLPLQHNLPGWWSKLEVFSLSGPVLYLDLDTVIVGEVTPLAQAVIDLREHQILMLRAFRHTHEWASGIMGWQGDWSWLLQGLLETPRQFIQQARGWMMKNRWQQNYWVSYPGDQDWIVDCLNARKGCEKVPAQRVQPGIYSYKHHIRGKEMPGDARIICFHGKPRPTEVFLGDRCATT